MNEEREKVPIYEVIILTQISVPKKMKRLLFLIKMFSRINYIIII